MLRSSFLYLKDRIAARNGAELSRPSLSLGVPQGASLEDFPLAPACPIEKVSLWVGFLYLTSGSELGPTLGPKPSTLSAMLSLHCGQIAVKLISLGTMITQLCERNTVSCYVSWLHCNRPVAML